MAKCDDNKSVKLGTPKWDGKGGWIYSIPIPCGKCLNCKKNRLNQWSFRLMAEMENAVTAKFVTLTYNSENIPITPRGFLTLKKLVKKLPKIDGESKSQYRRRCQKQLQTDNSAQGFFKRLRYYEKGDDKLSIDQFNYINRGGSIDDFSKPIKYFAVGEYGSKRKRPHMHIILFNVKNEDNIYKAWTLGNIHIDQVNNNTIDYTLKYMMKDQTKKKKGFDGEKEFSIMSKGIGMNFISSSELRRYYKKNLDQNYLVNAKGFKIGMPKRYRDEMLDQLEKDKQIGIIALAIKKQEMELLEKQKKNNIDPVKAQVMGKIVRSQQLNKQNGRTID